MAEMMTDSLGRKYRKRKIAGVERREYPASARKPILSEADLDSPEAYGMRKAIESKNLMASVEAGDDDAASYWAQKMGLENPSQLNVLNQLVMEAIRRKAKK